MKTYIHLKDKTTSQGINAFGIGFNNSTVAEFEGELPNAIKEWITKGILETTTKANFDKWVALQKEAQENIAKKAAIIAAYKLEQAEQVYKKAGNSSKKSKATKAEDIAKAKEELKKQAAYDAEVLADAKEELAKEAAKEENAAK